MLALQSNKEISLTAFFSIGIVCFFVLLPWSFMATAPGTILILINLSQILLLLTLFLKYSYLRSHTFLFSPGFWLIINMTMYFLLKSFYLEEYQIYLYRKLNVYITAFLFCYSFADMVNLSPFRRKFSIIPIQSFIPTRHKLFLLLGIFFAIKILLIFLSRLFSDGASTTLELSAATQNQGMAYLFNIGKISTFIYYLILWISYSQKKWVPVSIILTIIMLAQNVMDASRMAIILMIMINLYFIDKYIKKISWFWLMVLAPLCVFLIVFFGYVRNIEIGNITVYSTAFSDLIHDLDFVIELFMNRMDMLPLMLDAFSLYDHHQLPQLYGSSYAYMFLHSIPRNIWPSKPLLTSALVTSIIEPGAFSSGVNLYASIIIEGIMNLGIIGVTFSGLVLGTGGRILDNFKASDNVYKILLYIILFTYPIGIFNEGFHSNYIANSIYVLFLAWLSYVIVNLKLK